MKTLEPHLEEALDTAFGFGMKQVECEIRVFVSIVTMKRLQNCIEIGTGRGGLFYLLCKCVLGKKISIDLAPCCDHRSWDADATIIEGNSRSRSCRELLARTLNGEKVSLLFIDGDHSMKGVGADLLNYRRFVRPGGYIALHDVDPNHRTERYVSKFWESLRGDKMTIIGHEESRRGLNLHEGGIGLMTT